jgi:3'-phosphoadenosine 5'-phosphosulfate sulfotransferase (PAPS reductase)/FAD synthetase
MEFRDWWMKEPGVKLVVGSVQEAIDKGMVAEEKGYNASRNLIQTAVLLDTIEKHRFDAAIGGARRDEEKARAKERFSLTATNSVSGIPKISARNSGIFQRTQTTGRTLPRFSHQ